MLTTLTAVGPWQSDQEILCHVLSSATSPANHRSLQATRQHATDNKSNASAVPVNAPYAPDASLKHTHTCSLSPLTFCFQIFFGRKLSSARDTVIQCVFRRGFNVSSIHCRGPGRGECGPLHPGELCEKAKIRLRTHRPAPPPPLPLRPQSPGSAPSLAPEKNHRKKKPMCHTELPRRARRGPQRRRHPQRC